MVKKDDLEHKSSTLHLNQIKKNLNDDFQSNLPPRFPSTIH